MILTINIDDLTEARLRHAANNYAGEFSPPIGEAATILRLEWLAESLISEGALDWAKQNGGPMS